MPKYFKHFHVDAIIIGYIIGYLSGGVILIENGKVKVHVVKPR